MASVATVAQLPEPIAPVGSADELPAGSESGRSMEAEDDEGWRSVLGLPCELTVDLPLPNVTVADFLRLRNASVLDARWGLGRDVPLHLNGRQIGWVEFEVSGSQLAVRLTELA